MTEASVAELNSRMTCRRAAKGMYTVLMGVLLLGYLYLLFWGAEINTIPMGIWGLRVVSAILAVWLGKLWKDRGFQLLLVFLLYIFFRAFFIDPRSVFKPDHSIYLLGGLWTCTACYGMGLILNRKELKRFFAVFIAVWTIGMLVYTVIGLYAAWTGIAIDGPGVGSWCYDKADERLVLIHLATTSGAVLSISSLLALGAAVCVKNRLGKVLYSLAFVMQLVLLGLTASRTANATVSIGIGLIVGICLFRLLRRKMKNRSWLVWVFSFLSVAVVVLISAVAVMRIIPAFNHLKTSGMSLLASAFAEGGEQSTGVLAGREIIQDGSIDLGGRLTVWRYVWDYWASDTRALFFGNSVVRSLAYARAPYFAHCHNMVMQIVYESGIIGLIPMVGFLVLILIRICRLMMKRFPVGIHLLPVIVFSVWVGDLMECFSWFGAGELPISAFLFIAMGIVSVYGTRQSEELQNGNV